jgi:hypothetical protein
LHRIVGLDGVRSDIAMCGPRTATAGSSWTDVGAELIGEVARYEESHRLCYVRGPEGIMVALAEEFR